MDTKEYHTHSSAMSMAGKQKVHEGLKLQFPEVPKKLRRLRVHLNSCNKFPFKSGINGILWIC